MEVTEWGMLETSCGIERLDPEWKGQGAGPLLSVLSWLCLGRTSTVEGSVTDSPLDTWQVRRCCRSRRSRESAPLPGTQNPWLSHAFMSSCPH